MFENLCTLPLSSDLFTQALHPDEPILAVGLSSGHVQSYRLPPAGNPSDNDDGDVSVLSTGTSTIDTEWQTRRHKGSCRTLGYGLDGEVLYSAGTDGLLKAASSSTGQVMSKIALPLDPKGEVDPATVLHALTPQTLLIATDSAALYLYDVREPQTLSSRPSQTYRPHDDYISSLTPLPPSGASTSGYSKQWITTGGTTLAVTDLRRGVLVKSEDQEEELLSSVFVGGLRARPGGSTGEKVLIGGSGGVITLWEKGIWDDQDERIVIDGGRGGGESLDTMVLMPENVGDGGKNVFIGVGDGTIRIVKLGINKVIGETLRHDEVDAVVGLGFDVGGRLISGGGSIVKVWQETTVLTEQDEEDEADSEEETTATKRALERSDNDTVDGGSVRQQDSCDEEEGGRKRRKKKRKARSKKDIGNGIMGFMGL